MNIRYGAFAGLAACLIAAGCTPRSAQPVIVQTAAPVAAQGPATKLIVREDGGVLRLPDGTRVAELPKGGFQLPNGDLVMRDPRGSLILPTGAKCPPHPQGYLCP